jgi:hypothetical protein
VRAIFGAISLRLHESWVIPARHVDERSPQSGRADRDAPVKRTAAARTAADTMPARALALKENAALATR